MLQSPCTSSEPGDILAGSLLPFVWNFSWLFITSLGHFVPREKSTKYHIFESLRRKIHVSEQETSVPDLTRSNSKLENQKESKSTSDPKSDQLPFLACFSCIWDSTANPGFPRFIPPIYGLAVVIFMTKENNWKTSIVCKFRKFRTRKDHLWIRVIYLVDLIGFDEFRFVKLTVEYTINCTKFFPNSAQDSARRKPNQNFHRENTLKLSDRLIDS